MFHLSGLELSARIRRGEYSPLEVVDQHISRIESWNPKINAVTEKLFEQAREKAKTLAEQLSSQGPEGDYPVFFGVPFSIKEMLAVKSCRRTGGSYHTRNQVMDFTSTVVDRLIQAGGIPLCTTNVPELGFWVESANPIYGRTKNPYHSGRTSGGSSGGEGALIGAGASPFGLGSDIGGSIRMPASFCGVFGHKPTWKTVPLTGHYPFLLEEMKTLHGEAYPRTSLGFLARRATDLWPLLNTIKGIDSFDPETRNDFVLGPSRSDMSKLKVFMLPDPIVFLCSRATTEVQDTVRRAAQGLASQGAQIEELDPKIFYNALSMWGAATTRFGAGTFAEKLSPNQDINYGLEFSKLLIGRSRYTFPGLMAALTEKMRTPSGKNSDFLAEIQRIHQGLRGRMGSDGIILMPVYPKLAPRHRTPYFSPFDFMLSAMFNALGYPATSVPMGLNSQSLPLSVQVIGGLYQDSLNFGVACELEKLFGGWVDPQSK